MLHRFILAAALAAGLSSPALAQQQGAPVQLQDYRGQAFGTAQNPINVTGIGGGSGGSSSSGSVTAAGTNGSVAQAIQGITGGVPVAVSGTFFQATQPISAASLPLPAGAATAAKQPALGTAGSPAADVLSVQGVVGGTPQNVTVGNFPTTQPVSGTVTANLGTLNGAATAAGQAAQQGSVAPGTAAAASVLGGQVFNTTPPAPTNGQQVALQSDAAGNLKINNATLSPGAAQDATLTARLGTLGQKTMAASTPVTLASDQGNITTTSINYGVYNATPPTNTNATLASLQASQNGSLFVDLSRSSLPAFAATPTFNIGTAPTLTVTDPGLTALQSQTYTLASNAAAAGAGTATAAMRGADYVWRVEGTFAGLTAVLKVRGLDGTTISTVVDTNGNAVQCSAPCTRLVTFGAGSVARADLTGTASGTPSIYSALQGAN